MNLRGTLLALVLGLPAVALLALGPRGRHEVPPGRTVVRYWEKWSGVEALAMRSLVDRFNAGEGAAAGIWVDYNAISAIEQRMLIATAGGDPPEIAGLYDYLVPQYADQGALLPLDDLVQDAGIDPAVFNPVWRDICTFRGRLYALPSTPYTIALYYNRRLFRAAGLDPNAPPRSTAELADFAGRLTRRETTPDGGERLVQLGFTPSPDVLGWWHWVWPRFFGAELWDGRRFVLDTPAARAAYEWIADQRRATGIEATLALESTLMAIEGAQNPFLSERVAMIYQGPWMSNWIRTYAPDLDYGVAPFPSSEPGRQYAFASADVFVIPNGARHRREALAFLKYLLRREMMEELCRAHNKLSPFREPGPDFFATHPNPYIRVFDELSRSPDAFGYPKMPTWQQASAELRALLTSILRGAAVAPAVAASQARIDRMVAEYQHMAAQRGGS